MKITITRALTELKTLESRYKKAVGSLNLMAVKQGSKLRSPNSHKKEDDFIEDAKALNNSAISLYNRILFIKRAIDSSNSTTHITIGGEEITVQEALVRKKYIGLKEDYLSMLKFIHTNTLTDYNKAEKENEAQVERLISNIISNKDLTEKQKDDAKKDAENYVEKTSSLEIIDPCSLSELIEKIENEITDFKMNIDFALSELNSTTFIEIPD